MTRINTTTKQFKYGIRTMRLSKEVWLNLKRQQQESKLSWNLFMKQLINKK